MTTGTLYFVYEGDRDDSFIRFGFTDKADAEQYRDILKAADQPHGSVEEIQFNNPDAFRYVKRSCWDVVINDNGNRIESLHQGFAFQLPEITDEILGDYSPRWAHLRSYVSAEHALLLAREFVKNKFLAAQPTKETSAP